jgi:hypothetical protein
MEFWLQQQIQINRSRWDFFIQTSVRPNGIESGWIPQAIFVNLFTYLTGANAGGGGETNNLMRDHLSSVFICVVANVIRDRSSRFHQVIQLRRLQTWVGANKIYSSISSVVPSFVISYQSDVTI